jgi:hypothetical protein
LLSSFFFFLFSFLQPTLALNNGDYWLAPVVDSLVCFTSVSVSFSLFVFSTSLTSPLSCSLSSPLSLALSLSLSFSSQGNVYMVVEDTLYCLLPHNASVVWKYETIGGMAGPVIFESLEVILVGTELGFFLVIDLQNGLSLFSCLSVFLSLSICLSVCLCLSYLSLSYSRPLFLSCLYFTFFPDFFFFLFIARSLSVRRVIMGSVSG